MKSPEEIAKEWSRNLFRFPMESGIGPAEDFARRYDFKSPEDFISVLATCIRTERALAHEPQAIIREQRMSDKSQWPSECEVLEIIRQWKFHWWNKEPGYGERASQIDSNMMHHLAKLISARLEQKE